MQRAGLLLDDAQSGNTSLVASTYSVGRDTVRRWCQRGQDCQAEREDLEANYGAGTVSETRYRRELTHMLADAPRPGAPATVTEEHKRQRIAVAACHPEDEGVPVTHWSHDLLAQRVVDKGIVKAISPAHIGRFLQERHLPTAPKPGVGTSHHG